MSIAKDLIACDVFDRVNECHAISSPEERSAARGISRHGLAGADYVTITASSRTKSRTTEPESGVLSMSSFASISLARSAIPCSPYE